MKAILAEPRYFKESISVISDLVNEAKFTATKEGLNLIAMDPANVAMVVFKMVSSAFTEYNVPKNVEFAINLSNLKQILRRVSPNDMIGLELADNKLRIDLKGSTSRTFHLPLIEVEERKQKIPELQFPISVMTTSQILNNAIEDANVVADSLTLIGDQKKLNITAEGDLNRVSIEIPADDVTRIKADNEDKVKAKYSVEYLKKMMGGAKIADEVEILFNKDYPLKVSYTVTDRLNLTFILAPRVEND